MKRLVGVIILLFGFFLLSNVNASDYEFGIFVKDDQDYDNYFVGETINLQASLYEPLEEATTEIATSEEEDQTDKTKETKFESSNSEVATVDKNGKVTFKKSGGVTIKASYIEKGKTYRAEKEFSIMEKLSSEEVIKVLVADDIPFGEETQLNVELWTENRVGCRKEPCKSYELFVKNINKEAKFIIDQEFNDIGAKIDENGIITAEREGFVSIKVVYNGGKEKLEETVVVSFKDKKDIKEICNNEKTCFSSRHIIVIYLAIIIIEIIVLVVLKTLRRNPQ